MNFCFHCGKELPEGSGFCPYCGTQLASPAAQEPAAPLYEQPVQQPVYAQPPVYTPPVQQPVYGQPAYVWQPPVAPPPPPPSTGAKVMGYISMGLGFAPYILSFLILAIFSAEFYYDVEGVMGLIGILGLGFGIPARILAIKAASGNFRSAPTRLGSIFGLIAIIFGSILFSTFVLVI